MTSKGREKQIAAAQRFHEGNAKTIREWAVRRRAPRKFSVNIYSGNLRSDAFSFGVIMAQLGLLGQAAKAIERILRPDKRIEAGEMKAKKMREKTHRDQLALFERGVADAGNCKPEDHAEDFATFFRLNRRPLVTEAIVRAVGIKNYNRIMAGMKNPTKVHPRDVLALCFGTHKVLMERGCSIAPRYIY